MKNKLTDSDKCKRGIKTTHLKQLFCHWHDEYFDNKAQALRHQKAGCSIAEEVKLK